MTFSRITRTCCLVAAMGALVALAGCGKNLPTSVMVPTGYRPGTPPGAIVGQVLFDSTNFTGFTAHPFPWTTVELHTFHRDTLGPVVATQLLGGDVCTFSFAGLLPDSYLVQVRTHAFDARDIGPIRVELDRVLVPTAALVGNTTVLENVVYLIGTMPGFSSDDRFFNTLSNPNGMVGLWYYPDILFGPTPIAAGTYRFKFVTDESGGDSNLIGWGGDSTVTLVAPVENVRARKAAGPATDIKVTIPTTGNWAFELDERRTTFSIRPVPTAIAARTTRERTPR